MIFSRSFIVLLILFLFGVYMYENKPKPKIDHIAVINIKGAMKRSNILYWKHELNKALNDESAKGIIIKMSSPGGNAIQLHQLIQYISTKKPTVAYVGSLSASAGYEAIMGIKIYASPHSIIGSVGSISHFQYFEDSRKDIGLKDKVITNSNLFKILSDVSHPEFDAEYKKFANKLTYSTFHEPLLNYRPKIDKENLTGKVYYAEKALEFNFIDKLVQSIEEVKEDMLKEFNLNKEVKMEYYNIDRNMSNSYPSKFNIIYLARSIINLLLT